MRSTLFYFPKRVNSAVVRSTAAIITIIALIALFHGSIYYVAVLAIDFITRVVNPKYSLIARIAQKFPIGPKKMVAGFPKQLAAIFGSFMSVVTLAFMFAGLDILGWTLIYSLSIFAGLEAAYDFCIACEVYSRAFPCKDCK